MKITSLYLSFAAILRPLTRGTLKPEDLNSAILCCTEREMQDASHIDDPGYAFAIAAVEKARRENRLIYQTGDSVNNLTTIGQLNEKLSELGLARLSGPADRNLYEVPTYLCVPSASDGSYKVFWAACPAPWLKSWRKSWGVVSEATSGKNGQCQGSLCAA